MNPTQNAAYAQLVRTWIQHHELREHGAHVGAMVEARRQLDDARLAMARARH